VRPRQFTDEDILDATQACILELGPGVSTTVIADRVGMSQAAIFKRFGTKEKLVLAALCRPMQRHPISQLLGEGPTEEPVRDQMINMGEAILAVMRHVVPCMAMLHAAGINPAEHLRHEDSPPIKGRKMLTQWFRLAIEQGRVRTFNPHVMAVAFIGMLKARPFREIILADTALKCSDRDYVIQLVDILWAGIDLDVSP
jgi:AcrR family transcriptional regulator